MTKEGKTCRSHCPAARSLEIIGDRWSLLLIREIVFMGRREYGDFLQMMEGISTNILANRLEWLVNEDIFTKHAHPTNKKKFYYEITDKGLDLLPVLMELSLWGVDYVEGSLAPPNILDLYKKDPPKFKRYCKKKVQERSKNYLQSANK